MALEKNNRMRTNKGLSALCLCGVAVVLGLGILRPSTIMVELFFIPFILVSILARSFRLCILTTLVSLSFSGFQLWHVSTNNSGTAESVNQIILLLIFLFSGFVSAFLIKYGSQEGVRSERQHTRLKLFTKKQNKKIQETQSDLEKSDDYFRYLIENTLSLFFVIDSDGIIKFQSDSCLRFLGFESQDLVGRSFLDLIREEEVPDFLAWVSTIVFEKDYSGKGGPQENSFEVRMKAKSGEWHFIEMIAINLKDHPSISGILINGRDVTERKKLEEALINAAEAEQLKLAQDLHDGLTQRLAGIEFMGKMIEQKVQENQLPAYEEVCRVREEIKKSIEESRNLARGLYPLGLNTDGFIEALKKLSKEIGEQYGASCSLEVLEPIELLSDAEATQIYHIVREAVRNALRHGKATQIIISLDHKEDDLIVTIRDNGAGFNPSAEKRKGIGLKIMHHRARMAGGYLDLKENAGGGMTVTIAVTERYKNHQV